jgi:hypothetical protein
MRIEFMVFCVVVSCFMVAEYQWFRELLLLPSHGAITQKTMNSKVLSLPL